ncbi:CheW protein [Caldicellulosiruptor obsidiansis OB47]|uniref:CheW protein n=1 Tax=Caldicellulosiruptor obsidiansis (strain ATCC BAA-2073 / JCM 16842 / OB47) TaxID=608506 RepID=D9TIL8_CALOO|nr:chemotaxis protein CheW [Caldicellulosiruptor obsidiansis]ADL41850.1 CheW protein [Caldicellulosiruptor obsidiansis OB47]
MTDQLFSAAELEEIKKEFVVETYEHLENAQDALLQLESDPKNYETLNFIFREIHSIKGGANFLGLQDIINVSHEMESLLDKMRNYEINPTSEVINTILEGIDIIRRLADIINSGSGQVFDYSAYIERLKEITNSSQSSQVVLDKESNDKNPNRFELERNFDYSQNSNVLKTFDLNEIDETTDEDYYKIIVSFEYGNVVYGIEVEFVREIVKPADVTPIPFAPEHVMGLMNLRGDVVTIVDFGKLLGVEGNDGCNHKVLIIGDEAMTFGLFVDNVKEVLSVLPDEIKEANIASVSTEILKGIVERDGEFVQVIDIKKIIERTKNSVELI